MKRREAALRGFPKAGVRCRFHDAGSGLMQSIADVLRKLTVVFTAFQGRPTRRAD
jgi:hypothetical protein